jgi:hypothetical protein
MQTFTRREIGTVCEVSWHLEGLERPVITAQVYLQERLAEGLISLL